MGGGADSLFSLASRPLKFVTTFVLCYCNLVAGVALQLPGLSMIAFSKQFETTLDHVSKFVTVTLVCYTVGALSAGFLTKYISRQVGVIIQLCVVALGTAILPHTPSIVAFFVVNGVIGFGIGGFDSAQIAWMIDIWRSEAPPFVLTLYFSLSLGKLLAALLMEPFLTSDRDDTDEAKISSLSTTEMFPSEASPIDPNLYIPFAVTGLLMMLGTAAQFTMWRVFKRKSCDGLGDRKIVPDVTELEPGEALERRNFIVVALCCCFMGFYQSMEMGTLSFLSTYAQYSPVGLSEAEGSRVLMFLTLGYATARAAGILVVLKVESHYVLTANLVLIVVGNAVLLVWGESSLTWMWAGSICTGIGFSTVFPAFYSYIERYIFVSDRIASIITVSGGTLSALIYPLIVGSMVKQSPRILNYVNFTIAGIVICSFIVLFRFTYLRSAWK